MRISVLALLALAPILAACGTEPQSQRDEAAAARACAPSNVPAGGMTVEMWQAHHACMVNQYRQQQAVAAQTDSEDAAGMMLLGGTAFVNGWNTRYQRPMVTCYSGGSITQCY